MAVDFDEFAPFDAGAGADATEPTWRKIMRRNRDSGVISTAEQSEPTDELEVYADGTAMSVQVRVGHVWIDGHWGEATSEQTLTITDNTTSDPRIDLVVARADFEGDIIEIAVVTGTASATPSAPESADSASRHEIPLAHVTVDPGATAVTADKVEDQRRRYGFGRWTVWPHPPLYYEGDFGSHGENPVNMGTGSSRACYYRLAGKILTVRYFFDWGPESTESEWDGGYGRVYTMLPAGMRAAPTGDHRIPTQLRTHAREDKLNSTSPFITRDWMGTALVIPGSDNVYPFLSTSGTDSRIDWYRIDHETSTKPGVPDVGGTDAFPEGGHLSICGVVEVQ